MEPKKEIAKPVEICIEKDGGREDYVRYVQSRIREGNGTVVKNL